MVTVGMMDGVNMSNEIERREAKRTCYCRGCDKALHKGDEIIYTYTFRNQGQNIIFCLDCAKIIGELSNA